MIKKRDKLPVHEYVRRGGRTTHTACFSVRAFPAGSPRARVGAVVSSRTARTAVKRNRMKRLVFDFFRRYRGEARGDDVLVIVRPPAAALSNKEFVHELAKALN